jgi:hypothetical protein
MKRILLAVAILLCSANLGEAEFVDLKPVRQNTIGGSLGDIDCQLQAGHIYRDNDKVTWAHETCHGINARIRQEFGKPNGYYLLKNKAFIIESPKITLAQIANAVPKEKRGQIYQLYMIDQQRYWNGDPLYVLDELSGYVSGCLAGLDYNLEHRTLDSFERALEMWEYAKVAQELSRKSGFSAQEDLDKFMTWYYNNRILWISKEIQKRNWNFSGRIKGKPFITWRPVYNTVREIKSWMEAR